MYYLEIPPCQLLRAYVSHYQVLEIKMGYPERADKLLPFLGAGIIFIYKKGHRIWFSGAHIDPVEAPMGYVVPPLKGSYLIHQSGEIEAIACMLRPGVFRRIFGIPIEKVIDGVYTFQDLGLYDLMELHERIADADETKERVSLIEEFLKKIIYDNSFSKQPDYFLDQVRSIYSFKKDVWQLSQEAFLGERHFNRKFKEQFGFPPKLFSRIDRFHATLQVLKKKGLKDTRINLQNLGYAHLSHLNKEFKRFAGMLPKDYFSGELELGELLGYKEEGRNRKVYLLKKLEGGKSDL